MNLPASALPPEATAALGGAATAAPPSGKPRKQLSPSLGSCHGLAVRHSRRHRARRLPGHPDRAHVVGQLSRLVGPGIAVRRRVLGARQLPRAAHRGRNPSPGLRHVDPQHVLLRAHRRPCADDVGVAPRVPRQPAIPARPRWLPHAPLLPVGHERDRHHADLAGPVPDIWTRQPNPADRRHQVVRRAERSDPQPARRVRCGRSAVVAARRGVRTVLVAVAQRPIRGDGRDHADDDLDHQWNDDADLPRRAAEHQSGDRGGGGDRRGELVPALPPRHRSDAPPTGLPRRHARCHRDVAGVRSDLRLQRRWPAEDDADACLPDLRPGVHRTARRAWLPRRRCSCSSSSWSSRGCSAG